MQFNFRTVNHLLSPVFLIVLYCIVLYLCQAYHEVLATVPANDSWNHMKAFDISVGKRETYADYYVNDVKVSSYMREGKSIIFMCVFGC